MLVSGCPWQAQRSGCKLRPPELLTLKLQAVQGLELALRVLVAAGATRVRTLQISELAIHDTPRTADGALADPSAFEAYLAAVHAEGATHSATRVPAGWLAWEVGSPAQAGCVPCD